MNMPKLQTSHFAPVPQGSFSHFDTKLESLLVDTFDVSPAQISSCLISENVSKVFSAIIEYSAICPHPTQPTIAGNFFIEHGDPFLKNPEEGFGPSQRSAYRRFSEETVISAGSGTTRPEAPKTKLKMDLGHTVISWPPNKDLVPEFLEKIGCHDPYALSQKIEGKGLLHVMHYEIGEPQKDGFHNTMSSLQIVRVSTAQGDSFLKDFLDGVVQWRVDRANPNHLGTRYNLYRFKTDNCGRGSWSEQGSRRSRSHESVILSGGKMKEILGDIEHFFHPDSKSWYITHGLPHRRSYLFEGPPGTGKTSTIRVIAGKFGLSCCFLSMTDDKFSNQLLADALSSLPSNSLLVLEDVDSLFKADRTSANSSSLTFSGLLNCLDGVLSSEGLVTIMTTNHAERLDAALLRGGRVDKRFYFGAPNKEQIGCLFRHFYSDAADHEADEFLETVGKQLEGDCYPPIATLQQLFISCRGQPAQECIIRVGPFLSGYYEAVKSEK